MPMPGAIPGSLPAALNTIGARLASRLPHAGEAEQRGGPLNIIADP